MTLKPTREGWTNMEQQTGSKLGKEYITDIYCHPTYLTYMQSIWCKMLAGWSSSWNQDCRKKYQQPQIYRWYHSNGRKQRGAKNLLMKVKEESKKAGLKLNFQNLR